jgi:hypothetical protein
MVINRKVLPWLIAGVALAAILLIVLVMVTQAAPDSAPHRQGASISPGVVSYQGQVSIGGVPFSGTGYFRFAIVDSNGTSYWSNDAASSEYWTECSDWSSYNIGPADPGNHIWGNVHVFSPTSSYGIRGLVSEIRNVVLVSGSDYTDFSTACTGLSGGGNHEWDGTVAEPDGACGDDDNAACAAIGLTRGHTFNYTTTTEFTCGGANGGYVLNGGLYGGGDETSFESRVCLIHETEPGQTSAITLTVINGLFNALLGETNPITYGMFSDSDRWLRVRFDDGTHGVQLLEPDTRFTTAPFAFQATNATTALTATNATTATYATTALTATNATTATYATTALTATNATTATYATTALTATNATTATYATTALTATNATTAIYATTALTATNAMTATYATTALTATNATTATYATTALTATNVLSSAYATNTARGARVYSSIVLTVPTSVYYSLPFDSEQFDTDSIHSVGAQTLTCNTAGIYVLSGNMRYSYVITGARNIAIMVNNAYVAYNRYGPMVGAYTALLNISTIYQLNQGDTVILQAFQDSGANVTLSASGSINAADFMMVRLP